VGEAGRPSLARLQGVLAYQQTLLGDARRNRALRRALAARVSPGASVLDLGAGTGVWAVLAARLGAGRVVAVEREAVLVPVIEALARESGVAHRVEVVQGDARRVRLPRAFDVIVSEMVGNEGFEEGLVPVLARARQRFLRPGGTLIPEQIALAAAPVKAPVSLGLTPPFLRPSEIVPLAPSRTLLRVDLRETRTGEPLPIGRACFRVADGRAVGGLVVWVVIGLAPRVRLSTRAGTHWLPTLLPVEPLPRGPGRLEVEIDWNPPRRRWSFRFEGDRGARAGGIYAPLFAWGAVRPALRRRRLRRRR
jgi:predicted RNA methylase